MSCPPPVSSFPPGAIFDVHETAVEAGVTHEADLGPFADPFAGPVINFYSYSFSTLRNAKTLTLVGPKVPIRITWNHYSVTGTDDPDITEDEITLTPTSPSYTWPVGTEIPGTPPTFDDYSAEYDRDFVAYRVV